MAKWETLASRSQKNNLTKHYRKNTPIQFKGKLSARKQWGSKTTLIYPKAWVPRESTRPGLAFAKCKLLYMQKHSWTAFVEETKCKIAGTSLICLNSDVHAIVPNDILMLYYSEIPSVFLWSACSMKETVDTNSNFSNLTITLNLKIVYSFSIRFEHAFHLFLHAVL